MAGSSIIRLLPDEFGLLLYSQFDFGDQEYLVFEEKVTYVALQRSASYKFHRKQHFMAIAANLKHLNPSIDEARLLQVLHYIAHEHFHFIPIQLRINQIASWAIQTYNSGRLTPRGVKRRIVFNPGANLTLQQKLSIVGSHTKKGISEEMIYDVLEGLQEVDFVITYQHIANTLGCSERAVRARFSDELKEYKDNINEAYRIYRLNIRGCEAIGRLIDLGVRKPSSTAIRREAGFNLDEIKSFMKIIRNQQ
jgi:hypothetical protein